MEVICREEAVICGYAWFEEVFHQLDPDIRVEWLVPEGTRVTPGVLLCLINGNTQALLSGERSALNYLQTLSATATRARRYADAVAGTGVRILDTRKTLPVCGYNRNMPWSVVVAIIIGSASTMRF